MSDEVFKYFDRKFADIERKHDAVLAKMAAAVDQTRSSIADTAEAIIAELPAHIRGAFKDGVSNIDAASTRAQQASYSLQEATQTLQGAGNRLQQITRVHIFDHIFVVTTWVIGLTLFAYLAAGAYYWAKEPKIEKVPVGCTAAWDAKAQKCKGKWVPLTKDGKVKL